MARSGLQLPANILRMLNRVTSLLEDLKELDRLEPLVTHSFGIKAEAPVAHAAISEQENALTEQPKPPVTRQSQTTAKTSSLSKKLAPTTELRDADTRTVATLRLETRDGRTHSAEAVMKPRQFRRSPGTVPILRLKDPT